MPVEEEGLSMQMGGRLSARLRTDMAALVMLGVNVRGSVRWVAIPPWWHCCLSPSRLAR